MPKLLPSAARFLGLVGLPLLAVVILAQAQPSLCHTSIPGAQARQLLPGPADQSLLPALLALRDIGTRGDEGAVEEKGITLDLGGGVLLELVRIPPGRLLMGSPRTEKGRDEDEGPQHWVNISRPFYLGRYEVMQEQYRKVMGTNPSHFSPEGDGKNDVRGMKTDGLPVERVSWEEALHFCRKLSQVDPRRRAFCLPTEAEWEYACRAGTTTPFHFGECLNGTQANCDGRTPYGRVEKGPCLGRTTTVGSYPANAWGLYDMHGNVEEWCRDWHGSYSPQASRDPHGPKQGTLRVL
jgi:formylglycine-generating enzyme required for sulfatase activity